MARLHPLRGSLLLAFAGCGPSQEACDEARQHAVLAWRDVGDYFTRMAEAQDRAVLEAQAQLEQLTAERERHQRAAQVWRSRERSGLEDARTGEVHRDPATAREYRALAAGAERRTEPATDTEERAIAAAMEAEAQRAILLQRAELAGLITQAVQERSAELRPLLARAEELTSTELTPIALSRTEAMQAACE